MIDIEALRLALAAHTRVMRVVIAGHKGSSPREDGAAMLVWAGGQSGTIGGGALEYLAVREARQMLETGEALRLSRHALGPGLGQCCGGIVDLLSEVWDAARLAGLAGPVFARKVVPGAGEMPFAIRRALAQARQGASWEGGPLLAGGWLAEPLAPAPRPLWIWGAGHVGRALVDVLLPLPDFALTWVDTARARFPDEIPDGARAVWSGEPARLVPHCDPGAWHLIVTFSHAMDLELCHLLLGRETMGIGLIGSATKWARFRARLASLGHGADEISRITCPIGDMSLGKHPQAIAVGVAVQLLKQKRESGIATGSERMGKGEIADDSRSRGAFAAGRSDQGLSGRHRE